jgi:hypothetical protein
MVRSAFQSLLSVVALPYLGEGLRERAADVAAVDCVDEVMGISQVRT